MTSYVNSISPQSNTHNIDCPGFFHELPYPLGWRWRQFLYEVEAFERGEESSNFPFLFVTLNGLVMRWLAILFMSEHTQRLSTNNGEELVSFLEKLQSPSEGTWKQLIDTLLKGVNVDSSTQWMKNFRHKLCENHPFSESKKGINSLHIMQHIIQLRNHLLHSTRRLDRHETALYIERMRILFHSLLPLSTGYVIGYLNGKLSIYKGSIPVEWNRIGTLQTYTSATIQPNEWLSQDQQVIFEWIESESTKNEGHQHVWFWAKESGVNPISLWPFVSIKSKEQKGMQGEFIDLVFLNGWNDKHAIYLSYRDSAVYQHDWTISQFSLRHVEKIFSDHNKNMIEFFSDHENYQKNFIVHKEIVSPINQGKDFDFFWINLPIEHEFLAHRMLGILSIMPNMGTDDFFAALFSNYNNAQKVWLSFDIARIRQSFNHGLVFNKESYQLIDKDLRCLVLGRFHAEEILWNLLTPWLECFLVYQSPSISFVVCQLTLCLEQIEAAFSAQEKAQLRRQCLDTFVADNSVCKRYLSQEKNRLGVKEKKDIRTLLKQANLPKLCESI